MTEPRPLTIIEFMSDPYDTVAEHVMTGQRFILVGCHEEVIQQWPEATMMQYRVQRQEGVLWVDCANSSVAEDAKEIADRVEDQQGWKVRVVYRQVTEWEELPR